jgi:hypothetical protein
MQNEKRKQQQETYRATQARLTYLSEDQRQAHWTCLRRTVAATDKKKFVALRTPGGIHFLSLGAGA